MNSLDGGFNRSFNRVGGEAGGVVVPTDGPDDVFVPSTAEHWTELGIAVPDLQVNCQVASGNLIALIGAVDLVANGTVAYQQAITDWVLTACATTENSNSRFTAAAASGPNPATQSVAWLTYSAFSVQGAARPFLLGAESTNDLKIDIFGGATPGIRLNCNAATTNSTGTGHADGLIRPYLLKYNRTASTVQVFTINPSTGLVETINGTYSSAVVDGVKGLGGSGATSAAMRSTLCAAWAGANAETLSAATLTALGF